MSLLRESILKHLLLEKKIAAIRANLTVVFNLRYKRGEVPGMKSHAEHRKNRHEGDLIRDYDILKAVEKAKDDIVQYIVIGELYNGVEFVIKESSTLLNIPVILEEVNPYEFNIFIKTVMKKLDFTVGMGQIVIWV
jgi:hydroxyethylthiazole kinase-like sugar kinase family protein